MAYQIIQQPNELYMIWSMIDDEPVILDATKQEIIDFFVEECIAQTTYEVNKKIEMIRNGKKPYYQFSLSFDDVMAIYKQKYGGQVSADEGDDDE
jgi:hypothetical protein